MWRRLVNALTWLLVAGSVAIILGGLTGRPVLLAAVPTRSMTPVLAPGDLIPVIPLWGQDLNRGQIVVFRTEEDRTWIVHRIVGGSAEEGYITQGDANGRPDPNRVFPRHVAGLVPRWGSGAMRVPRLGSLSLERSPLSSPLIAGIAMVLGVYLLITDVKVTFANLRKVRVRPVHLAHMRGGTVLAVYIGLGTAAFVGTLLTTYSLGAREVGRYRVVETMRSNIKVHDVHVLGSIKQSATEFQNKSPIPMIVGLQTDDTNVVVTPSWAVVPPYGTRTLGMTLTANELGEHKVVLRRAAYLPLLPVGLLRFLSGIQWYLPAVATALVPGLFTMMFGFFDPRARHQIEKLKHRLLLRWRL